MKNNKQLSFLASCPDDSIDTKKGSNLLMSDGRVKFHEDLYGKLILSEQIASDKLIPGLLETNTFFHRLPQYSSTICFGIVQNQSSVSGKFWPSMRMGLG
jgi:hypothetical protein